MRKASMIFIVALMLAGCVGKPVPDGYSGPLARIADSSSQRSATSVDFFYLGEINGRRIPNSVTATRDADHVPLFGRLFSMIPTVIDRQIPAEPSTFKIYGRTEHTALTELLDKGYEVSGETTFTPLPDHIYWVRGELRDDYLAVWIEDISAHQQLVGQKIEKRGSSTPAK
jgi:hypothetical protein